MRNILEKVGEKMKTHFIFNNFFRKSCHLRKCRKIWWSQAGHRWRHNMAHTSCMLDKQGYTHVRTLASAHTQIYNIYYFSTATMIRERASIVRYTYIVCLVFSFYCSCEERTAFLQAVYRTDRFSSGSVQNRPLFFRQCIQQTAFLQAVYRTDRLSSGSV
jgi:hypothetical protein